jgi:CspA family cold shock protein
MQMGVVKWWNSEKGHGFIRGNDNVEYFVHYSGILGEGKKQLERDEEVDFVALTTVKGPRAIEVRRKGLAHVA